MDSEAGTLEPALVFQHNHKAGGTSLKTAFEKTLCTANFSCVHFEGNRSVLLPGRTASGKLLPRLSVPSDFLFTASEELRRRIRVIVVTDHLWTGLCSLLPRRCLYLTTMRSPMYQLISFWNFLCLQGRQNRLELMKRVQYVQC